jgi:hydrogenase 3 maturation protease
MSEHWTDILKGKLVIVGIGNLLRGDDGFGPRLIEELQGKTRAVCIDAGSAPESFTGKIIKENPDTVLLADAVHLNLKPGAFAVLNKEEILKSGFSTHEISPNLFIEYLEGETRATIYLLGVQPGDISFGAETSEPVKKAVLSLAGDLKEAFSYA